MHLTYRGIQYDYTPAPVETKQGELAGRYRGLDWRFCNPSKHYVQQPNLDLMYRGVAYQSNPSAAEPAVAPPTTPVLPSLDRARALMMRHHQSIKTRQQSMMTRVAQQVGLDVPQASSYWNRIQGKVHPSFRLTYDRSGAAMS